MTSNQSSWTVGKIYELFPPLWHRAKQLGGSLSGGEQQMLAICRSLMTNPSLLLMDEPTEGLSPIYVQAVGKIIRTLHHGGIAILLVEQKLSVVLKFTDYVHIMSKGRIVFSCSPSELEKNQEIKSRYLGV
jgi:branched-chain amino acid transport system ATP-binding protein